MAAQLYSETQIAECLYEVLSELVEEGTIEEPLAVATLNQVGHPPAGVAADRDVAVAAPGPGKRSPPGAGPGQVPCGRIRPSGPSISQSSSMQIQRCIRHNLAPPCLPGTPYLDHCYLPRASQLSEVSRASGSSLNVAAVSIATVAPPHATSPPRCQHRMLPGEAPVSLGHARRAP
jgi:hypothetical protein